MYKILPYLIFSFAIKFSFGQIQIPIDTSTGKVSYTEIVYVDSVSKKELMGRAVEWIALNYKSANDVIQLKDEERFRVIAKGLFKQNLKFDGSEMVAAFGYEVSVYHTVIMDFRDGRCKIQMTDFSYSYYTNTQIESDFETAISDLERVYGNKKRFAVYKKGWVSFYEDFDNKIHLTLDSFSKFIQNSTDGKLDDW